MAKKYIPAEKLKAEIERLGRNWDGEKELQPASLFQADLYELLSFITSLQQGQPDDVCSVIKEYYGKELLVEDERTKAAYHFFSAGRAFELKKIEEERVKHITDLLDNYQKGKKAGYKEAVSELKEGKIECNPVMKELIDKLFGIGHAYNFGFGPKDFQQEWPIKVYRVENEKEQKGLWRKFDGTWEPLFDMLTDGQCKDMPMEDSPIYREGGKQWFASAPSKETLQKWFSKRDLEELLAKGFTISEFEVVGHKKISDFEYIFTRDNIISRKYLKVSDIYPLEQPEVELEKEYKEWWETRVSGKVNIEHTMEWFMYETARHFFNLGLKARKI